jgi:ABC-2 type transport system permease protein
MDWSQLRTILWLRWRLTRNQLARGGGLNAGISIAIMIALVVVGAAGGVGGVLLGCFKLHGNPPAMLAIYDGLVLTFLLFWCIGVISTIQRSESIDISKLLHLPVSLKGVFLINYTASHVTLSIVVFLPAMLGLAAGLALGRHGTMLLLVLPILGLLFAVTAWTYCLRGWLVILMQNPRRYRAAVAVLTMTFVLLCQLPNLLNFASWHDSHGRNRPAAEAQTGPAEQGPKSGIPSAIIRAHKFVPPLWVGNGAMSLASGDPAPTILAGVVLFGIGGFGLARAYRSTRRFYEGWTSGKKVKPIPQRRPTTLARGSFLERRLPGISEDAAAMALASLQSLRRATEVKAALAYNVVMILVFAGSAMLSHSRHASLRMQFFYATGIALLPFLGMTYLMANQFGFDRSGFRTLVLSPMPRSQILLGKNLAMLPVGLILGLVYLALAAVGLRLRGIVVLAATVQLFAAFFLTCIPGNAISSLLPHRIREGTLAATKVGAAKALLGLLAHMISMTILSLLFLPAVSVWLGFSTEGLLPQLTYLVLSVVELFIVLAVYSLTLASLGRLLEYREKEILRVVTQEVE